VILHDSNRDCQPEAGPFSHFLRRVEGLERGDRAFSEIIVSHDSAEMGAALSRAARPGARSLGRASTRLRRAPSSGLRLERHRTVAARRVQRALIEGGSGSVGQSA